MTLTFVPVRAIDPRSRPLIEEALRQRAGGTTDVGEWAAHLERDLDSGRLTGILALDGPALAGVALWEGGLPLGANVHVLAMTGRLATVDGYASLLEEIGARSGGIALSPGPLPGLSGASESSLMTGRGFGRYGRSEMRRPPGLALPPAGPSTRAMTAADEPALGELHRRAYSGRFDRYLFLQDTDEVADSTREVHDLLTGRWGALDPAGSVVLEEDGRPIGSVIAVDRPDGVLLADVAVDPPRQGRGLGKAIVTASVRGLIEAGRGPIYLNVTEGNLPAIRTYTSLGFVRSMGPTSDWYNVRKIPVAPQAQ